MILRSDSENEMWKINGLALTAQCSSSVTEISSYHQKRQVTEWDDRCMAVVGTVWSGDQFCGYKAKGRDLNGRPCCGHHMGKQHGILWYGDRYWYPEGTGSKGRDWTFKHGESP